LTGFCRAIHSVTQAHQPTSGGVDLAIALVSGVNGRIVTGGVGTRTGDAIILREDRMPQCRSLLISLLATIVVFSLPAAADPVADFYKGKTINMVIGVSVGGDYDRRARLIARHMSKHIPGNPTIVANNMTGGGGVVATNWLANVAPQDGTALLMITSNMPTAQAVGTQGVKFDVRKFFWLGNTTDTPNVINSWHTTGITTIEDVMKRELVVGATGVGSGSYYYPAALNVIVGTKFKIVTGYPGGNDMNLAMERGELGGRGSNSWASWKSTRPQWLADKKIFILVQVGLKRDPELKDVPLMQDLAKNPSDAKVLTFLSADTAIARAVVTTPGVPTDRVAALRKAFAATMKDPEFLAEAEKSKMDLSISTGEQSQAIAAAIVDTPADVVQRAAGILKKK
jgi:tripartite-type tricarboxylate transporter receptor subunit TctC